MRSTADGLNLNPRPDLSRVGQAGTVIRSSCKGGSYYWYYKYIGPIQKIRKALCRKGLRHIFEHDALSKCRKITFILSQKRTPQNVLSEQMSEIFDFFLSHPKSTQSVRYE